ncbi:hypothetical protein JY651_29795 [Pyxidicoccus parkwayensis]|uniref:Delta-60 repeat domain-containing protein n=1 Tax=Pyxidicoccus parkwayensis TaxID=2813578 RepID=A0ABX7NKW4_9BACT|nr:delta-60 repeat domain-containing protein [Pyxidicoccus parkwaysis]QSQ19499.1 hypothetical protein JY651_29795 [Pyxidicoccus parkwaysis]
MTPRDSGVPETDSGVIETDAGTGEPDSGVSIPAITLEGSGEVTLEFAPGAPVDFPVQVVRKEPFSADVTLSVVDLPPHVKAVPVTVPGTETAALLSFTVDEFAAYGRFPVKLVAVGGGEQAELALTVIVNHGQAALDSSFGNEGVVAPDLGQPAVRINNMAAQPDGKWVLVGSTGSTGLRDVLVARLLADGTPDPDFGTKGVVVTDVCGGDDYVDAVTVLSDGRILVAGGAVYGAGSCSGTKYQGALFIRYTAAGALDTTFGGTGVRAFQISAGVATLHAVTVDSQGRIVGAGTVKNTDLDLMVMRLTPTGEQDKSFSSDGLAWMDLGDDEDGMAVVTQSDDKVVVTGTSTASANLLALVRFNADGTKDSGFSYASGFSYPKVTPRTLHLLPDGKLLVGGKGVFNSGGATYAAVLARMTKSGALDTSFESQMGLRSYSAVTNTAKDTLAGTAILPGGEVVLATWSKDAADAPGVGLIHVSADGRTVLRAHRTDLSGDERPVCAALGVDGTLGVAGMRTASGQSSERPFMTRFWPY